MLKISQLLLDLYSCPTRQDRWSGVLDQLCGTLRVRSAVIQILYPADGRVRSRWTVRDSRSQAAATLHDRYFSDAVNPRMLTWRPPAAPDRHIFRDPDMFEPGHPALADLRMRLAAAGLGRYMSARVDLTRDDALSLVLHRDPNDEQDFTKREERIALELMPHLRQAVQLAGSLQDAKRHAGELHETVDNLRFSLLLCNADSSPCWSNMAARCLLEKGNVLWLNGSQMLTTPSTLETAALRQAIARAARDATGDRDPEVFMLGGNGSNALQVRIQAPQPGNSSGRALVIINDPNIVARVPADLLKKLFGLSPAEARLAAALCVGETLDDYAAHAGVAIGTARYQLKQVMAKTQVSKQSQLVQRLCTSVIFQVRS